MIYLLILPRYSCTKIQKNVLDKMHVRICQTPNTGKQVRILRCFAKSQKANGHLFLKDLNVSEQLLLELHRLFVSKVKSHQTENKTKALGK